MALPPALGDCASVFLQPKALGGLQFIEKGFTKTENFEHIGLLLLFLLTLEGLCLRKFSSVQCCCRSKETLTRTIRDKEPRTATSAFTQLLSSCIYTSTYSESVSGDYFHGENWYTFPGDGPLHMH